MECEKWARECSRWRKQPAQRPGGRKALHVALGDPPALRLLDAHVGSWV